MPRAEMRSLSRWALACRVAGPGSGMQSCNDAKSLGPDRVTLGGQEIISGFDVIWLLLPAPLKCPYDE